ncbi:hypothetical protein MNBD_GAMMA07-32 [hydrothermal vent metagenome]|uniref:SHSP domain-containing protein n=1 Tax=hydrothermal vent metagenome TaxID=652676 RepID=A0A3B0WM66_9ZZZZ
MNTAQHLPWNIFDQLQHEIYHSRPNKNLNQRLKNNWAPAVDIKEEENQFVLIADIPGVNPEDIDIQIENKTLTIKGERNLSQTSEQENLTRIERKQGTFYRRFTLPEGISSNSINAKSSNGVLTVIIKKQEEIKPKKITVN